MKKLLISLIVLLLGVTAYGQQKIQLRSANRVECTRSDMTGLQASFSFSSLDAQQIQTTRGELTEIYIEGTFPNGIVGEPQLPMFTRLIAIPTGATPVVSVGAYSETDYTLSDYGIGTIAAMQAPVRKNVDPSTVEYAFSEAAYARNSYNDDPVAMVEVLGTMRGITLGRIIVRPVRYNPVAGTVKVFNDIEVSVDFENGDAVGTEQMFKATSSPAFNSVYNQIFNFDMLTGRGTRDAYTDHPDLYNTPVKMLVICYSGFQGNAALNSWLEWKLQKGYYVDIYYTGSGSNNAGTTSDAIATFIKNKYNASVAAGNAYTYLIVIGDTGQVPYYIREYIDSTAGYVASDLGYASVDFSSNSNDVFPDMYYSRMSVENTTHLTNYINKVLTYEKFEFTDGGNYLNNVILVGGWDDTWTSLVARPTINYATTYYFNTSNTTYGGFSGGTIKATISTSSTQGYSGTNNGCYQGINNGACFVNYTAHGNKQEWSQPLFTAAQVATLTNTGKYFFGVGNCCLTGNFNNTSTTYSPGSAIGENACFAETMIRVPNAGAIAYIGCSDYSIWMEDYYWAVGSGIHFNQNYNLQGTATTSNTTTGVYDAMFRDDYWNSASSLLFVGNIAVTAAENNSNGYDTDEGYKYYFKYYHTFGDGSVMPYVTKPETNTVMLPSTVIPGASSITVNALAGSYVSVTNNSSVIYGVGVANSSGEATVNFTNAIPTSGELHVVVTRQQYQPYFGTIEVVGGTQYTINATAKPTAGGTVQGAGQYYENTECTLTATPATHYAFDNWTLNNAVVSTEPSYTFTVTGDASYTANFHALTQHHLTYNPQQTHGTISVSPTDAYMGDVITLTATHDAGYCLYAWHVTTENNTEITVVNNQFEMPDSDVTVTAEFRQGYTVTLASVMNGTISATPTLALDGETITLTATPATGYNLESWDVFKTGDLNTTVTVTNNTFTMPAYDVTVSAVFSKPAGGDVTVGSGTSTSQYIPTYNYYDFSLTQQIYTKAEVGAAGAITHIAFYVSSNPDQRKIDIYMSHTSKSSFSSTSDWVAQGTSYRVVQGYQTFGQTGWNVIPFATPFEYNGTDNLLVTVDDNTDDWSSNKMSFYVYSTGENRAHYTYQDDTDFNPASISANSSYNALLTTNNQVVFTKEVPSTEGILSVSPTSLSGFNAVAGNEASDPQSVAVIGSNLEADLTITAPTGYEVCATQNGTYTGTLTLTPSDGNLRTSFFVRLSSDVDPGIYSGNLTLTSGTTTATVSLNGEVIAGTGNQYTITVNASPANGGTVAGGGTFYEGSHKTLTATPATHYTFTGWQLNGSIVSTDNPYTIEVTGDATYTAIFEEMPQYTVTVTQTTGGAISASPTTAYPGDVVTLSVTLESGYFLVEWNVTDANNHSVAVTDNEFTMPNSNVTVTAVLTQGFSLTLVQTEHGTISASQTSGLQPGDLVTLTATPDNGCVFLAWYAYMTGNPRDVVAVISNTTILMPSSDVTVQAIFVTEEEQEQTVGGGNSTGNYLPTNAYYKYSLTQQIYTAAEIAYNGRITAIAFKALANISSSRSLDIYMSHTDLSTFGSNTSWEVMGSVALVFSGSVSFANNDWTTITLDTPFEYDGTSNLNICVIDKTGNDESGTRAFSTYGTSANRALYIYSDDTDYSNMVGYSDQLSNLTGTLYTSNNQIKFTIKVPGSAASLTVSPDAITDFSYVEGQGPSGTQKLDIVGVDLENDITVTAPTNFEISLTEDGTYSNSLTIARETGSKGNRTVTSWDFEDGLQGWTVVDADGDGYNWTHNTSFGGHDGSTGIVYSQSYDNSAGTLYPDNWLISPQVELGGSFSMWAHPQQAAYPAEHFGIYVSTTNTDISSFTLLDEWTLSSGDWKQFSVDLRLYTGQTGYIAVRHFNGMDQFYINVDDFVLDTDAAISIEMPVTITPATVYVRMKENLNAGSYSGTLTATAGQLMGDVSLTGQVTLPTQTVSLVQGWNWWTPMLVTTVSDLQSALGGNFVEILPANTVNLQPGQMYEIKVSNDCENVVLSGHNPEPVTVSFDPGLNPFGYTGLQEAPIEEALNGFTPTEGDMINSFDEGFAIYNGQIWEGTLQTLVPGHGYEYLSRARGTKSVTF